MELIIIIGVLAVIVTGIRLLPQIIKTFRTKKVRDISLLWEIIGVTGSSLWLFYGYLREDILLMIGVSVLVISYMTLIFQKFKYS